MKQWHVLYVNSRAERKVAERLKNQGWEVFCPIKSELRTWSDRKKKVEVPFFSSYVFVRFSFKDERLGLLQTPGVVKILFWLGMPAVIRDQEMCEVMDFFNTYANQEIVRDGIVTGRYYTVKDGIMEGKKGIVIRQNSERAILDVPGLNVRFSVEKKYLISCNNVGC